jgi:hypothetical protein
MRLLSLIVTLFCLCGLSTAQIPSLPAYYSGPFAATNAVNAAPIGWSWSLNGAADISLEGAGTSGRMNLVGHFVQIDLGATVPSSVSYWLNSNSVDNKTVLVQHSTNGTIWTTVATHTQATVPIGGVGNGTFYSTAIPNTANFIRFIMTVRDNGRFEIDGITINGAGINPTCSPTYTNGCGSGDFINNFSTTGGTTNITNNNTGCNGQPNNYIMYPSQIVTVTEGNSFNVSMQSGASWSQGFRIWVDWNGNGVFTDAGENVYNSVTAGTGVYNGTINVPLGTSAGPKVMRVRCAYNCVPTAAQSCGAACSSYGETEDYIVQVVSALPPAPRAIHLTTNPQWVNIGDLDVSGNQITVEALVYYQGGVNIISKHTDPSNVNYLLRTGTFELTTTNGFCLMSNPYAGSMLPNTWYHVAGTYDGSFVRYYVNGCLIVEQPWTGNLITNNLAAAIGSQSTVSEQYYGQIDEVRIWNVARTQAQIGANMLDLPSPTTQPGLLGYYKMDNSVVNVQGNAAYNGTWVGAANYVPETAAIPTFALNDVNPTNSTCLGANNGVINILASGSSLQYSLNGTTWQGSNNFTGLTPGTYTAYVRSPEGCIIPSTNVVIGENNIPQVPIVSASNPTFCVPDVTNLNSHGLAPGGQAFQGNGTNAVVEIMQDVPETNFSIEMWVKTASANTGIFSVSSGVFGAGGHDRHFYLAGGQLWIRVWAGAGWNTGHTLNDNNWHHIALTTQTGVGQSVYVDGALIATFPYDLSDFNWQDRFFIGYSNDAGPNAFFTGQIDNVRYWNVVRSQAQIIADMYLETPSNSTGLVSHLPLNGNTNALVGSNGTASNATWVLPNHFTYTWTTGPSLPTPSTNEVQTTGSIATGGAYNYYVLASNVVCTSAPSVAVPVTANSLSTPIATLSNPGTICPNTNTSLTASGGVAGTGSNVYWYTGSNGTGTLVGTGTIVTVAPTTNTTYYVRREGTCNTTADASVTVNLKNYVYANNGATSNTYCTDNAGWNHFFVGDDIIFSLQGNISSAPAGFPVASIADNGTYYQETEGPGTAPGCSSNQQPGEERFEMERSWNIDMGGGAPIGTYDIRFYFQPAERTAIEAAAAAWMAAYPACGYAYKYPTPNGFYWFKNSGSNYVAPQYEDVQYTSSPGTTSNGVNYAQWTGITGFSGGSGGIILVPIDVLPVELTSLTALCNNTNDEVSVRWSTATEHNSSHYNVERSVDGSAWNLLTSTNAAGNSTITQTYEVKDYDVRAYETIYYRLQQFDQDGTSKQYGPVSVSCTDANSSWEVFPNPAGNEVTILLKGDYAAAETEIRITDINGKVMQVINNDQQGQLITVDLRSYAPGVYIVRLVDGENSDKFVRLVKQ